MSESPDVKALDGRGAIELLRFGQHGRRATRRAVAKANESVVEKGILHEADLRGYWSCQGFLSSTRWPVPVRKNWGVQVPDSRRKLKAAIVESTAVKVRKVWRLGRRVLQCQRPTL